MGKYGKKNHVNLNPLSYSHCLLGEAKVGKTTLVKDICEKLVGEEGYMFLELGQERGCDSIEGVNHINCPEWQMEFDELTNSAGFYDVCMDIIENKISDYPELKIIIWDTYDQLITITEKEVLRMWNKECRMNGHPEKATTSLNAAFGGFGKAEKKAIELMFNMKAELKKVGVETFVIGHVKTKDLTDVVSGETYQTLTSDQQQNYFNALKKNLHFLGLAYIDRSISREKTGKKNIVTGKEEVKGKIKEEKRRIKFRDDNYAVDSGSRFANIVEEISLDADEWIKAVTDAIKAEQAKSSMSYTDEEQEQKKLEAEKEDRVRKAELQKKYDKEVESLREDLITFISNNKTNMDVVKPVVSKIRELGYNPAEINSITEVKDLKSILAVALTS